MPDALQSLEEALAGPMDRRRFLQFTGALAGAAAFCQVRGDLAHAAPRLSGYPFSLGVASGDPAPNRVVLWTRLAPEPLEPDGGMPHRWAPVVWRVAKDPAMRRVVRAGITLAVPELAHSVHVEVGGLEPRREYYFQFRYRDELSPVGRTLTAPSRWHSVSSLNFAFASCQRWDDGYYSAYRRMAEEDLAFVVHLGDYFYEYGIDENGGFRGVPVPEQYRARVRDARALSAPARPLQDRPRPAAGTPAVPVGDRVGRPRGAERLCRSRPRRRRSRARRSPPAGRRPTRRSTSTFRCGPQPARATARPCSTGA